MAINTDLSTDCPSVAQLGLPPGFRFHPTDVELVWDYLRKRVNSEALQINIIKAVDLYKFDPWELSGMALSGENWYFFSPRDRKYPRGDRPNRAAKSGFWKATGRDKPIYKERGDPPAVHRFKVGSKKCLVFYTGKPPGKTNWMMHEYRLEEGVAPSARHHSRGSKRLDDWVLCRIYEKSSHAQRAPLEHESMRELLPEIDDQGVHTSEYSAAPQEAILEGKSILAYDNVSEEDIGSLTTTTTLPVRSSTSYSSAIQTSMQTSAAYWESQASTSHGRNFDEQPRIMQELEAYWTQISPPTASLQFSNRVPFISELDLGDLFNPMPTGCSSISDEESQSTFQDSVYGFESMYPDLLGYNPQNYADIHRPTTSNATPGLSENSATDPSARNGNISYEFPSANLNNFH